MPWCRRAVMPFCMTFAILSFAPPAVAQTADQLAAAVEQLEWRPATMGGRVSAIEGVPGDPLIFWVGGADGGVFMTTNAGTTFEEQFTDHPVYSIGALALAESDHNVLWLGSGEGDPRNSTSYGNGVYRSTDGGTTWTHLGLGGTERIKRIVVHPQNADIAYVCAMGHAWGPNEERGVYRTTDGGATWEKVLYRNRDTGCSDVAMDYHNPRVLYAGMWTYRRRPWRFDDGGGETALYKSTDGGTTWTRLTEGMPKGPMARIGVQVSRSHPNVVYMVTETPEEGTLFRSDDAGTHWRMVNDDRNINFRPFYYSDIRVDPNDPNVVYSLSGGLFKSIDGGATFRRIAGGVHGDHQAFWIDPEDSRRLLSGSDGGFQVSYDAGETWDIINNVTLSQFYQIAYDMQRPYYVCGGLQDNGSWCGPSQTTHGAILKDDWFRVSGGDGFYAVPVPDKPHLIYSDLQGGVFMITDMRSGATRRIHPYPNRIGSAGDAMLGHKYRFNWDSPIHISPHDPGTVYIGGNVVFKSTDYGHSWQEISPDLTTGDTTKQLSSGGEIYQDNTAAEFHTTVLTIAESPVQSGVIWAGTDDGKVWVTRDGGASWTEITRNIRGLPEFAWVAKIDASHFDAGTAYIAVDQHRMDDFTPHAYRVSEFGERSEELSRGLPQDDYVKVIREDTRNPDLLYVGMERGIFASWDRGETWVSIRNGLPPVSVRDIQVHPRDNDLIIGTHGRGAYILDDIAPLQTLGTALAGDVHLFEPRPAVRWETGSRDASMGQRTYRAPNPPYGALLSYYLKEKPEGPVKIVVTDLQDDTVRVITVRSPSAGVNRTAWDLRYAGPDPVPGEEDEEARGFFGGRGGPLVVPGKYTISLGVGERALRTGVVVEADPRVEILPEHYVAQRDAALALRDMISRVNRAIGMANSLQEQGSSKCRNKTM
ncbi:MAG: WD40/YVTN/BNR-like repeat-containing protein, partial [Gemmatimonadales bacterium]